MIDTLLYGLLTFHHVSMFSTCANLPKSRACTSGACAAAKIWWMRWAAPRTTCCPSSPPPSSCWVSPKRARRALTLSDEVHIKPRGTSRSTPHVPVVYIACASAAYTLCGHRHSDGDSASRVQVDPLASTQPWRLVQGAQARRSGRRCCWRRRPARCWRTRCGGRASSRACARPSWTHPPLRARYRQLTLLPEMCLYGSHRPVLASGTDRGK